MTHPRSLIVAGASSQVRIVESFAGVSGTYLTNAVTEIVAKENAVVDHYKLQRESTDAFHVASLDLYAERGKVLAVLGPNGAGKTTFIRSVATLLKPTSGTLKVAGIDVVAHPGEVRRLIGLAGQYAAVEPAMTGRENLVMVARLFGHGRRQAKVAADIVLEQLSLTDADRLLNESGDACFPRRNSSLRVAR